jgi:hypothetical protein
MPLPLAIPLALAGLGLASHTANYFGARSSRDEARRQLADLGRQALPEYTESPELRSYYNQAVGMAASPRGYSAAERAAFRQNMGRTLASQRAAARNIVGGSQARALGALDVLPRISAETQFAASDASLGRQQQQQALNRMYQGASAFQGIRDRNAQMRIQRRLMQEQALGGAIRSNQDYMRNTLGNMGSDLLSSGITMGMMGGFGKTGGLGKYKIDPTAYAPSLSPTYGALGFNRQVNEDIMSNSFSRPRRFSNIND